MSGAEATPSAGAVGPGRQLTELLHRLGGGRRRLDDLPPRELGDVGAVQRLLAGLGGTLVQADATTCGSAALVVVAAAGDPRLRAWLAGGVGQERVVALQQRVKSASTRGALLGLAWPGSLGTPPWGAARTARFGTVTYGHRLVVDSDPRQSRRVLDHAILAAHRGFPVLLYTGGDTRGGAAAALPRHVVVLTSPQGRTLEVYEPSSGRLHPVTRAMLLDGGRPRAAYGGWSHVTWAVLPRV